MAKSNLPSVDNVTAVKAENTKSETLLTESVVVEEGYISTNMVDLRKRADTKITTAQAIALRDKLRTLQDRNARLKDGSEIRTKSDAIRWMIENPLSGVR